MALLFVGLILAAALASSPGEARELSGETLTATIAERDAALFSIMFDQCDPQALAALVTADLEFYHDRGGVIVGGEAFVEDYRRNCEPRSAPDAWRSRRALDPATLVVNPIPGVGATSEGAHSFYERRGDGPERLAGHARFLILWRHEADGEWRVARVFSIDHRAAE